VPQKYDINDLDYHSVWTNWKDAALYIQIHDVDGTIYRATTFTIDSEGTYHPSAPPIYKSGKELLRLIASCGMEYTTKELGLVDIPNKRKRRGMLL
jgi:hypothetical protein